jgi:hypothetical protein
MMGRIFVKILQKTIFKIIPSVVMETRFRKVARHGFRSNIRITNLTLALTKKQLCFGLILALSTKFVQNRRNLLNMEVHIYTITTITNVTTNVKQIINNFI